MGVGEDQGVAGVVIMAGVHYTKYPRGEAERRQAKIEEHLLIEVPVVRFVVEFPFFHPR